MDSGTALVTGVSSGLGRATANLLVENGWDVIGTTRNADRHIDSLDEHVAVTTLDVTDSQSIERFAEHVRQSTDRVDLLVNNAGFFHMGPIEASSMDQIRLQFETNVFGLIAVTKMFLAQFREQRSGTIVNIASVSAVNGYPFVGAYAASKAAVLSLTESMNIELAPFNVKVKAVLPGTHATSIFSSVDLAKDVPDDYRPAMQTFFGHQSSVKGSDPATVAQQVLRAVVDGKDDRVRYFAGPDARPIPMMQRLMGQRSYFRFMKRMALKGPGPIVSRFLPQGDSDVEISEDLLAMLGDPPSSA